MSNLVIVESPAKAKTIGKYLGPDYRVIASAGHVRDVPSKEGSIKPEQNFAFVWEITKPKSVKEILTGAKKADTIYLATDGDREGEAISWHISELIKEKMPSKKMVRAVFYEITPKMVKEGIQHPRNLNDNLVGAYMARRALDFLVGFGLSPVLWKRIPGSRSAGRVQSVALRIITEREREIEDFVTQEYWSLDILGFCKSQFKLSLYKLVKKKMEKFSLANQEQATKAAEIVSSDSYIVSNIERKQLKRNPKAPFDTATFQQESARKLGIGSTKAMQIAQKLYEGIDLGEQTLGLITYMRTDSTNLNAEAVVQIRELIKTEFGQEFVPDKAKKYETKSKSAQEAHEAIRPTDITKTPESLRKFLSDEQLKVYDLIWKKTVACQMESALFDQLNVFCEGQHSELKATGSTLVFQGFLAVYSDQDDEDDKDKEAKLPNLVVGDKVSIEKVTPKQHFTEPPARYNEASFVKTLKEMGIGRPSTYDKIPQLLLDRGYIALKNKQFWLENRGRLVTKMLETHFNRYVEYDFTAKLEEKLDSITTGKIDWHQVLQDFWTDFDNNVKTSLLIPPLEFLAKMILDAEFKSQKKEKCPICGSEVNIRISRYGPFFSCSKYPECAFKEALDMGESSTKIPNDVVNFGTIDKPIFLKKGPFGPYLETSQDGKLKRVSLPKGLDPQNVTQSQAELLISLPKTLGTIADENVVQSIGKFGPYLLYKNKYINIKKLEDFFNMTLDRAGEIINQPR